MAGAPCQGYHLDTEAAKTLIICVPCISYFLSYLQNTPEVIGVEKPPPSLG